MQPPTNHNQFLNTHTLALSADGATSKRSWNYWVGSLAPVLSQIKANLINSSVFLIRGPRGETRPLKRRAWQPSRLGYHRQLGTPPGQTQHKLVLCSAVNILLARSHTLSLTCEPALMHGHSRGRLGVGWGWEGCVCDGTFFFAACKKICQDHGCSGC